MTIKLKLRALRKCEREVAFLRLACVVWCGEQVVFLDILEESRQCLTLSGYRSIREQCNRRERLADKLEASILRDVVELEDAVERLSDDKDFFQSVALGLR